MEKDTKQPVQDLDILDVLLDEDNEDPITLYDENSKPIRFDQVAVIPLEDKLYTILKPIDEIKGVADDEAIVFAIDENEGGETTLMVETNEPLAMRVFDEYYKLLDEQAK